MRCMRGQMRCMMCGQMRCMCGQNAVHVWTNAVHVWTNAVHVMVERLAGVLRRREELMRLALPAPTGAVADVGRHAPTPASQPRHLSVADLRRAEQQPPSPPRRATVRNKKEVMKEKRTATLGLPKWIKEHRFLKAVPLESGESSVALLLLWEADHHRHFPTTAEDIRGRMTAFTKSLSDDVAADTAVTADPAGSKKARLERLKLRLQQHRLPRRYPRHRRCLVAWPSHLSCRAEVWSGRGVGWLPSREDGEVRGYTLTPH